MSERLHNTHKPLGAIRAEEQRNGFKPRGLWYGFGDAWLDWCASEMPGWIGALNYEIVLHDAARILVIEEPRGFRDEYADAEDYGVDWVRVAREYDGVEIPAYDCWEARYEQGMTWYYGWDCASGCIWNPRAIREVRPVSRVVQDTAVGAAAPRGGETPHE